MLNFIVTFNRHSELVGWYILSPLTEKYSRNIGLYRDNGLAALNSKPHKIEKIKKELWKVFSDNDLNITVEANKTKVNFLSVMLDIRSEKYWPYTKEGNIPPYPMCTENLTILPQFWKTLSNSSTNDSPKFPLTKNASTAQNTYIKRHSTEAVTITDDCFQRSMKLWVAIKFLGPNNPALRLYYLLL